MKMLNILALTTMLLAGCGWQLRDAQVVPGDLGAVHITSKSSNSELMVELRRTLKQSGVSVAATSADSNYSIVIVDYKRHRRTATVNSNVRVAEYQLNEDVDFLILGADGKALFPMARASVERTYLFDERDILAAEAEEAQLRKQMRGEIIRQILNRLRVIPAIEKSPDSQ